MPVGRVMILAVALVAPWVPLSAQTPERVRGTLETVEGDQLGVRTREGALVEVRLKPDAGIFVVTPSSLEDIEAGDFVGITSIEESGRRRALEVHLFAEDLRGVGEGHYPWDLVAEPNMMTNATIAEIKEVGEDRELEVTYAEGEGEQKTVGAQTIFVPLDVPIVLIEERGTRAILAPGKPVFLKVEPSEAGPQAVATVVGEGIDPPM